MEMGHNMHTSHIQISTNTDLLAGVLSLLGNAFLNTEPLSFNEGKKRFSRQICHDTSIKSVHDIFVG